MKWITYAVIIGLGILFAGLSFVLIVLAAIVVLFFLMSLFPDLFGV